MITVDNNKENVQTLTDDKYRLIDAVAKNNPDIPDDLADFIKSLENSKEELDAELLEEDEEELDAENDTGEDDITDSVDIEELEDDDNDDDSYVISEDDSDISTDELNNMF